VVRDVYEQRIDHDRDACSDAYRQG
jgi:hypothetical protein